MKLLKGLVPELEKFPWRDIDRYREKRVSYMMVDWAMGLLGKSSAA